MTETNLNCSCSNCGTKFHRPPNRSRGRVFCTDICYRTYKIANPLTFLPNFIGQRFNRLEVIEFAYSLNQERFWKCRCDCGNFAIVPTGKLRISHTKSCGCLNKESSHSFIDFAGQRFGMLTVIEFARSQNHHRLWKCLCDCGNLKEVSTYALHSGHSKSCGCYHGRYKHGMHKSAEYQAWADMRGRCQNKNHKSYDGYGGRGILVCERWNSFENFIADIGLRPSSDLSLERINNEKGYSPDNCKWATRTVQNRNRRDNRFITFNDETHCLSGWAAKLGIHVGTLSHRLKKWSVEKSLTTPVDLNYSNRRGS